MSSSDIHIQKALVTGRILHKGTGTAINGTITMTSDEGSIVVNVRADGTFAVSGEPNLLFPKLATLNATFHLHIRAESAQFRAGHAEKTVIVALAAGEDFNPPVAIGDVLFDADHVYIRGRVVSGAEPFPVVNGATVDLLAPIVVATTVTAADGTYAFDNIVVLAPVSVRCSHGSYITQTRALGIDYGVPVNELSFRMHPV